MFTSRSAVESYHDCPRYRFNQYHYNEKGLAPVQKSVPLVTGGAIHRGVEHLLNRVRIGQEPDVQTAVDLAVHQYIQDVGTAGFDSKYIKTDKQQWFTFEEQKALTEALIRAWFIAELPMIQKRYTVLAVERDIEPIEIVPGVWFQAKVDAEFQDKETGDFVNYSLKSAKSWGDRMENSYKSDLQSITEMWAVEEDVRRLNKAIEWNDDGLVWLYERDPFGFANVPKIREWLSKRKQDKKIGAIRFCFVIKGTWMVPPSKRNEEGALRVTYNPLIRGYKNITPSGINYAHSWNYPNPDNPSGKGALGRGWEPFNAWEEMGIAKWIEMLQTGEIQPQCGDIIKAQVVTPIEYFRSDREMELGMREVKAQEKKISDALILLQQKNPSMFKVPEESEIMDSVFYHVRKHCEFHFGNQCEYKELCWNPEVSSDPIGSGLYQIRMPHHDAERGSNVG